jgi:flagellar biogenesis protein FliO
MTPSTVDQLGSINSQILQYVEVILALGGVLLLAFVTLKVLLPRFFGMRASEGGPIRVLARFPLEPRRTLYLVEVASEVFLIATAEGGVSYLASVSADKVAEALADSHQRVTEHKSFRNILAWLEKGGQRT